MAELVLEARAARVTTWRQQLQDLNECMGTLRTTEQRLAATVREAGQAAIRADDLGRRFGLTNAVPCAGTDLQGQCQLLGDAREARALIPGAQSVIARLAGEKASIELELGALRARCQALAGAPQRLGQAERACEHARARVARLAQQVARSGEIAQAHEALSRLDQELAETGPELTADGQTMETPEERAERLQIHATRQEIARQIERQSQQLRTTLDRLHQALATLPAPFDAQDLADAQATMERASRAAAAADQAHMDAVRDAEALAALALQARALADRQTRAASRIAAVETELSNWNLFTRCMSNDGLIALAIDDAGPALSGLANDLLLACYGTRFTVSILTLLEAGRGEQKEGFDIVVHDGESGQSKSVALMSGGERVWISCRIRHEIHYAASRIMPSRRPIQSWAPMLATRRLGEWCSA